MKPANRTPLFRIGAPMLLLVLLSLSCGTGGSDFAGGGTGGTGISTGEISGFGSVVVNDVHFRTDNNVAPGYMTGKWVNGADKSHQKDRDVFSEGMVVTVRHGTGDNNARVIEYRDNLRGPIGGIVSGADNVIEILGQAVVVDNAALFLSLGLDEVVEVSGYADNAGRIRAAYVSLVGPPMPPPFLEFEVNGFVSGSSAAGFRLGPLPDGSGTTVTVSFPAGGPANGSYVQVVTTDRAPVAGIIAATRVEPLAPRTDFPEGAEAVLTGLVTTPWGGAGNDLSFEVEGKRVVWSADTAFIGGVPADAGAPNRKVQVQGTENGGVLSASTIVFR